MSEQDWTVVTIRGKKPSTSSTNASANRGTTHSNANRTSSEVHELRKVESKELGKPKMLTGKGRADLASARVAKGLTQKQLDMRCSFAPNSCNTWEAGRSCPSSSQIQILHNLLGIKLERH